MKLANGSPLRQEKYASAPVFNDHLKASTVARKCALLTNPIHKELCLHLQYVSMQPGGLSTFVDDFLNRYGDRIGSKAMRKHVGKKIFHADIVREVRAELKCGTDRFPLKDEWIGLLWEGPIQDEYESAYEFEERMDVWRAKKSRQADRQPTSYPATSFIGYCMDRAGNQLEEWLIDFCLNPDILLNNPPSWFHALEKALADYFSDRRTDTLSGNVVTSIGEEINDALDYAWEEKVMVHINGIARMGKTFQIKQWCAAHPGRARYVQVPSGNDDISFFRAIARALGTAAGSAYKNTQIKRQIEDAIQDASIMLVLDEAHYLIPQYRDVRRTAPRRINWLLTEVVNKGIPVALVTTPQFDTELKAIVDSTGWASEQLDGRIAFRVDLPAVLPESDLASIAKNHLPNAEKKVIDLLCWYAQASGKYLAGIEAAAKRARFLVKKTGKATPGIPDLLQAMQQVEPAMKEALSQIGKEEVSCKPPTKAKQRQCRPPARAVQASGKKLETVA